MVRHEHEINVRTVIQFAAPQLSERNDGQAAGLAVRLRHHVVQNGLHNTFGQK